MVSNNVANNGAVGFKSANAHFADVYAASREHGGGASQVRISVSIGGIQQQFTQGNITSTSNPLDIAINGGGFFKMNRDNIVTYAQRPVPHRQERLHRGRPGFQLMGYSATPTGTIVASDAGWRSHIDKSTLAPQPTGAARSGNATAVLNLDSRATPPTVTPFNFQKSSTALLGGDDRLRPLGNDAMTLLRRRPRRCRPRPGTSMRRSTAPIQWRWLT